MRASASEDQKEALVGASCSTSDLAALSSLMANDSIGSITGSVMAIVTTDGSLGAERTGKKEEGYISIAMVPLSPIKSGICIGTVLRSDAVKVEKERVVAEGEHEGHEHEGHEDVAETGTGAEEEVEEAAVVEAEAGETEEAEDELEAEDEVEGGDETTGDEAA